MNDLSRLYGEALFKLALNENLDESLKNELNKIYKKYKSGENYEEFISLFRDEITDSFDKIFSGFSEKYDEEHDTLTVQVTSAFPLDGDEEKSLRSKLNGITGKEIHLISSVDKSLLGGIILEYGGNKIDGSLKTKLQKVKNVI